VVPIYQRSDRFLLSYYRPISLALVVCKEMEHVIGFYLRKISDRKASCCSNFKMNSGCAKVKLSTVCCDITGLLDNGGGTGTGGGSSTKRLVYTSLERAATLQAYWITEVGPGPGEAVALNV
jgi:hypothetical protein